MPPCVAVGITRRSKEGSTRLVSVAVGVRTWGMVPKVRLIGGGRGTCQRSM